MKLNEWLNSKLFDEDFLLKSHEEFMKEKPFRHLVIKDFLIENKALELLNEIKKEKFIEKESDLFQFKQTDDLFFSKNQVVKGFNEACLAWDFFELIEKITSSRLKGTLDMAATLYESTDFLLCHDDKLEGRKIAYVLYLSEKIEQKDGGSFVLYNSKGKLPADVAKKIPPVFNSLLLFEVSKKSFHEVEENISNKKRYAIGGWLH